MLFNSYVFLFLFFPVVLAGYYALPRPQWQLAFLLLMSLVFYAYWSITYLFLLIVVVVLDFWLAAAIHRSENTGRRRGLLILSLVLNLGLLFFFKYAGLVATTINHLAPVLPAISLVLPIGLSFYTFQSLSYVIDVYRRHSSAHPSLLSYSTYVTMFPHQISGPLVRHNTIIPQLEDGATYRVQSDNLWRGAFFFVTGLAKKILIADFISRGINPIITNMATASNSEAWLAMVGYTLQLYFDFSGYSDMATGLCLMLNIRLPQNFDSPYKSGSITEFWQRWHMTLSSWLRDYLYISLGGNRGTKFATYRNLMLTMALGGLWHGATWMFVLWGIYHGLLLAIERATGIGRGITPNALRIALVFLLAALGWILFRAPDLSIATVWYQKVFLLNPTLSWDLLSIPIKHRDRFGVAFLAGLVIVFAARNTWRIAFAPSYRNVLLLVLLFALCLPFLGDESPFLYFQF
ncbi:MAG TPA: MBOAT family O-acyltransferase [Turneriella sp.]|nr:MBOAT family O-acyltransferase [Turneriella sp.]